LQSYEPWVARERARRPHPARLAQALAHGHNLDADRRPARVLDTRVEHTADIYENRLVNAFCHQVNQRLRRLLRVAESPHRTGTTALVADTTSLLDRLGRARRQASFLDQVSLPAHLPTRLTMVLLNRPPYRAALEGFLELHRSAAVRLEEPALEAPLENLPQLYQVWGTLEVLLALLDVAAGLGYQVRAQHLIGRDAGGVYVRILPDGEPALMLVHPEHQTVVKLIPERSYGRRGPLRSISFQQRPDIAVEVQTPGDAPRVYLFDPKYKLDSELLDAEYSDGQPKKVDIDKMHAYRDAIRDPAGRRMVQYAAVLYPGPPVRYDPGIEALPAYPGAGPLLAQCLREVLAVALDAPTGAAS
jgi:predicted component of viral defense system (DUF524 family)